MKQILVATDFSTRSDRAMRRASLLAKQFGASLTILHVVDDDRPAPLVAAEKHQAERLLADLSATIAEGLATRARVSVGEPFDRILRAGEEDDADLIVIGAHRREVLRDVFVGTTAERTIRLAKRPILMANAVPATSYRRLLVATDFSVCSTGAVRAAKATGLLDSAAVAIMHAFEDPTDMMLAASLTEARKNEELSRETHRLHAELSRFAADAKLKPANRMLKIITTTVADAIREAAREWQADLIVIGTHGRTGFAKFFLGSAAEALLAVSDLDVLVVRAAQAP